MHKFKNIQVVCPLLLIQFLLADCALVIGIDLGSENMKIAILKPGKSFEVALNSESQRKTPVAVSIKNNERLIGHPALSVAARFPQFAFLYTPTLLGRRLDDEVVKLYQATYPYHNITNGPSGTITFVTPDKQQLSVEELVAMVLEAAIDIAVTFASEDKDAISKVSITVPPFYGQAERLAMLRAAEYAGITNAILINSNAAVAINYGSNHIGLFNATRQWYMFFDMGASSTIVTVSSFQVQESGKPPLMRVRGVGYNATMGVNRFIDRLSAAVTPKESAALDKTPREAARLRSEAGQTFKVLSANRAVGGVTRDHLRSISSDLLDQLRLPVEASLNASGIKAADLAGGVLLMGGGSRCPMVQEELLKISGRSDLGKSINTDESAALGAVYAAVIVGRTGSAQDMRHLPILLVDATLYPICVTADMGSSKTRKSLLKRGEAYPQIKSITFEVRTSEDFAIELEYCQLSHLTDLQRALLGGPLLFKYSTKGFPLLIQQHSKDPTNSRQQSLVESQFHIDSSGLVRLLKLEAFFSGSQAGADRSSPKAIEFSIVQSGPILPSDEMKQASRNIVQEFRRRELAALALARGRNDLEAAVLNARSRLQPDEGGDLARCTSPAERLQLLEAVSSAEQSLTPPPGAGADFFNAELTRLRQALGEVEARATELQSRPVAIARFEQTLSAAKQQIATSPAGSERLAGLLQHVESWRTTMLAELAKADPTKNSPVLAKDIDAKRVALERMLGGREIDETKKQMKERRKKRQKRKKSPMYPLDEVELGDDEDLLGDDDDDDLLGEGRYRRKAHDEEL